MKPVTVWQALMRPPWRFLFGRWPWRALIYLLISAVLGFVLLPIAIITVLLIPLWGIMIGALERRRTRILGFPRQASGHVRVGIEQRHNWLGIRITEAATWRETAALLLNIVFGWTASAVLLFQGVAVTTIGALAATGATGQADIALFGDHVTVGPDNWWLVVPIGPVMLCLFAYINALLAAGQASLLRVLCGPRQRELARNVERLVQSRAALVEAFESERRRIERDLHDGVQQELVTLAARLGMVSLELDDLAAQGTDTGQARDALDTAQDQAEHAMATLRNTVRGIHPAVLTDHGLRAALDELADRTPLRLSLDVADFGRLPSSVETAAYYLVTEAISNAAKHTAATRLTVRADIEDNALTVAVTDNGHGGADENAGTGLRGLRERAETLGGQFALISPDGDPQPCTWPCPSSRKGPRTMRLLLAEDSALLREALTALLERLGHTIAATAQTAPELLAAYGRLTDAGEPPDLVLTDVRMPPDNSDDGLRAALDIRTRQPNQPIMVLSQYIADRYARELLTLPEGAIGYLLKDRVNRIRDFAAALETVASGGTVIDPDVVQHLLSGSRPGPLDRLTTREREVLGLMADGQSNTDIATALTLTNAAVSKHIGNIFVKFGLSPVDDNRRVKAVLTYVQGSGS